MKKIVYVLLLFIALVSKFEFANLNADGTSSGLGFDVPESDWGTYLNKETRSDYIVCTYDSIDYYVGYARLEGAVYEYQDNNDYSLVIIRTTSQPYELDIYYNWWLGKELYDGVLSSQKIESDIDSAYYPVYQGAYYSSVGFNVETYSPINNLNGVSGYTLQLFHDGVMVEADVDNSGPLSIYKSYNSTNESILFTYDYDDSAIYSNNSSIQSNNGMYLIDKGSTYYGNVGSFLNKIEGHFYIANVDSSLFGSGYIKMTLNLRY